MTVLTLWKTANKPASIIITTRSLLFPFSNSDAAKIEHKIASHNPTTFGMKRTSELGTSRPLPTSTDVVVPQQQVKKPFANVHQETSGNLSEAPDVPQRVAKASGYLTASPSVYQHQQFDTYECISPDPDVRTSPNYREASRYPTASLDAYRQEILVAPNQAYDKSEEQIKSEDKYGYVVIVP